MLNITKRLVGSVVEWTASEADERGHYTWRVRVIGDFATIRAKDEYFNKATTVALALKALAASASLQEAYDYIATL